MVRVTVRRRGCTPLSCLIGIVLFIFIGVCFGGVFFGITGLIRDSDVVQEALARANAIPRWRRRSVRHSRSAGCQ